MTQDILSQMLTSNQTWRYKIKHIRITFYLIEMHFNALQTEQTQIMQLLYELPDQGLLCLLIEIWYIRSYTSGPDK